MKKVPNYTKVTVIDKPREIEKLLGLKKNEEIFDKMENNLDQFFMEKMEGKVININSVFGPVNFKPFYNSKISNFIDSQGPGSTDLAVPMAGKVGSYVLIYIADGAIGDSLIIYPIGEYKKKRACKKIIEITNIDENDGYDSDDDF